MHTILALHKNNALIATAGLACIAALLIVRAFDVYSALILAVLFSPVVYLTIAYLGTSVKNIVSQWKMMHSVWLFLLVSVLMFKARSSADLVNDPVQSQQLFRMVTLVIACCLALVFIFRQSRFDTIFKGPVFFLLFYCVSSFVSVSYSSFPGYSAWKAMELAIDFIVLAAVVMTVQNENDIIALNSINMAWNTVLLASVLFGALIAPAAAFKQPLGALFPQLYGVFPIINANSLGFMTALSILYLFYLRREKGLNLLPFSFSLFVLIVLLLLAQSRTAMIGLAVSASLPFLIKKRAKMIALFFVLVVALVLLDIPSDLFKSYFLRGRDIHSSSITTVSGRTEGWTRALDKFSESPFWGYGMASGARFAVLADVPGREDQAGLHNAFLDVIINNGIIGFVPWITVFIWTFIIVVKNAAYNPGDNFSLFLVSALILFGIRMITGDSLVYHDFSTLIFLPILAQAQLSYLKRQVRQ